MERKKEPIAIVGIGCRFPGGSSSPKAFWNLLRRKKDAIVDVPEDRWDLRRFYDADPGKPGKMYVRQGGFLKEKIDRFDPLFFGISPREAESLDPQQRLLLEVTWEAFEDGGLVEDDLRGSSTGVFIGGFCMDSMLVRFGQLNREIANSHSAASSTMTMLSNRISYAFDLKGPSVTMDTACSSSLVATHFACRSLWSGESETAIVGGVNVMLRPEFPIVMSKGKFLSPHGRCKAFDEDAAGYGRGEGAGVVILKPLSEALEAGDRVYGLIRETGMNQDGHTAGITLPDSESQEKLMREVYRRAGVSPGEIGYVEAHGTGTQAGDPAEIGALHRVLSEGRPEGEPCQVGSVKTNIGHLEAGAGVAGLIKAVLTLHHEAIPPNLHFNKPNPKIPWDDVCIQIPTKLTKWKRSGRTRYAGLNSFGYGGANAHVLLQEAPQLARGEVEAAEPAEWGKPLLLPFSARSEEALRDIAAKYAFQLATRNDPRSLAGFFYTATHRRTHHSLRATVVAEDVDALRTRLQQFSEGDEVEGLSVGRAEAANAEKLVFVYTGMGPQWWGMGRELMEAEPLFLQVLEQCDAAFQKQAGWSILEELRKGESNSGMARTEVAQPANFVIQVGLTRLWKAWGITPYSVIGHSVGEVAAAYVSGALSLEDAIAVSLHRSRLQQILAGRGAMVAAGVSESRALELMESYPGVSIAAVNGPNSVTLSGETKQIEALTQSLETERLFARQLKVEVAYHSSQMEPIREELLDSLKALQPRQATIPLYSTVVGDRIAGDGLDADYWWQNVRQPVRFLDGIRSLLTEGSTDFLEVGPHPVLGHSIKEIAADSSSTVRLTASLNRKKPEQTAMLESLGKLYAQGQTVGWGEVTPSGGRFAPLPTYPWQRERYWVESTESREDRISLRKGVFLNRKIKVPQPTWSVEINESFFPYLKDHVMNGQVVFPGAGFIEAGLMVARHLGEGDSLCLRDVRFHTMLQWDPTIVQTLYVSHDPQSGSFYVHSGGGEAAHWQLHSSGALGERQSAARPESVDLEKAKRSFGSEEAVTEMYAMLRRRGMQYGTRFQRVRRLWKRENELWVEVENAIEAADDETIVRPEILDTAFHSLLTVIEGDQPFVPQELGQITVYESTEPVKWIQGKITNRVPGCFYANLRLIGSDGRVCVTIRDIFMRRLPRVRSLEQGGMQELLYKPEWKAYEWEESLEPDEEPTLVFASADRTSAIGEAFFQDHASRPMMVFKGPDYDSDAPNKIQIREGSDEDFDRLLEEVEDRGSVRILYLWSLDIESRDLNFEEMVKGTLALVRLVRAIGRTRQGRYSLSIVTRGAHSLGEEETLAGLNASVFGGLVQLFENECDNLDCRLVDLDPDEDEGEFPRGVANRLLSKDAGLPKDLAIRKGNAYSMMLERYKEEAEPVVERVEPVSPEERVVWGGETSAESGAPFFRKYPRISPEENEAEIRTHYLQSNRLGRSEPAGRSEEGKTGMVAILGTVVDTGAECTCLSVGDRVLSLGSGRIENYTTVPSTCVLRIPDAVAFENLFGFKEAMSAYYGLAEVARLKPNERVIVDQNAGSVALFAIQIAKHLGAAAFALTGQAEKNVLVDHLESDCLIDGSQGDIVEQVLSKTEGDGANVFIDAGGRSSSRELVRALAPCGCVLEILDTQSTRESPVPQAVLKHNLLYSSIDIDRLIVERRDLSRSIAERVLQGFIDGWLCPAPVERFPAVEITEAVDRVTESKQPSSVALEFEGVELRALPEEGQAEDKRDSGTVIITGGNSGFGLQVAKWLADTTPHRIALLSRSGAVSEVALSTIAELRDKGVDVVSEAIDVTNFDELKGFLDRLNRDGPPLRGVLHGAMVLEDAFLQDLEEQGLRRVMEPKVLGAIHLYHCVKDVPLDFFVCFSSISSLVGNRGQASYIAANSFLDAFARRLRGRGFPAVSINWGVLSESGVVARNEAVGQLLEKEGVLGITNQQALSALESILPLHAGQIGVFKMDWDRWRESNPRAGQSSRFASFLKGSAKSGQNERAIVLVEALDSLDSTDQLTYLTNLVIGGLSKVLKIPAEKIGPDNTLDNLGIDSLMLIELSLTILSEFGLNIPAAELPKYPTVNSLASNIQKRLDRIRQTSAA